jgi:hypothetical protein
MDEFNDRCEQDRLITTICRQARSHQEQSRSNPLPATSLNVFTNLRD